MRWDVGFDPTSRDAKDAGLTPNHVIVPDAIPRETQLRACFHPSTAHVKSTRCVEGCTHMCRVRSHERASALGSVASATESATPRSYDSAPNGLRREP
jgi:hypothetical protein